MADRHPRRRPFHGGQEVTKQPEGTPRLSLSSYPGYLGWVTLTSLILMTLSLALYLEWIPLSHTVESATSEKARRCLKEALMLDNENNSILKLQTVEIACSHKCLNQYNFRKK